MTAVQPIAPLSLWRALKPKRNGFGQACSIHGLAGDILRDVSDLYRVPIEDIRGSSRLAEIVHARWAVMDALYRTRRYSYPEIGRFLGGKNHATVINGVRRHGERMGRQ